MLYSLKEIHTRFGISVPMLKKLILHNKITVVKIGVKNFIRESIIEQYITNNTVEATA